MQFRTVAVFLSLLGASLFFSAPRTALSAEPAKTVTPEWHTNYDDTYRLAEKQRKMLFLYFQAVPQARTVSESSALAKYEPVLSMISAMSERAEWRPWLEKFVFLRIPQDYEETVDCKAIPLIDHPAFADLQHEPGIAILDFHNTDRPYYRDVVSICPFKHGKYYAFKPEHVAVLCGLPSGTISQRTMIFAVRIHPENPASTWGEASPVLYDEATAQAAYQAQIRVQGHHQWESRFHRIISRLFGRGTPGTPVEVVAESWPGENLVDSCVDCVDSWRQSSGHWSAVSANHSGYGYDISRGGNGIWYATGIFSN